MKLEWRLRVMMAERGIHSAAELSRRLEDIGVRISSTQLTRIVKTMPKRLNTRLLCGLMKVLECGPEDLIRLKKNQDHSPRPQLRRIK